MPFIFDSKLLSKYFVVLDVVKATFLFAIVFFQVGGRNVDEEKDVVVAEDEEEVM